MRRDSGGIVEEGVGDGLRSLEEQILEEGDGVELFTLGGMEDGEVDGQGVGAVIGAVDVASSKTTLCAARASSRGVRPRV